MKTPLLIACTATALMVASTTESPKYLDPKQPVSVRVEDLLARMTLEEKIGQMNMPCVYLPQLGGGRSSGDSRVLDDRIVAARMEGTKRFAAGEFAEGVGPGGGFFTLANTVLYEGPRQQAEFFNELQRIALRSRLKIPLLQTEEGTHGFMASGATIFPEGPALGSTWNLDLIERIYAAVAREARSVGVHQLYTLVIEPTRDPRLGRNEEGYSEDPYLVSQIAGRIVAGIQRDDISAPDAAVAGLCHFPGQSQPIGGLERGPMEMSERVLREIFLPPWEAGIGKAGALGVMLTYPAIDGVPSHASSKLVKGILRGELGFRGLTLGEGGGISTLVEEHVAADAKEAGEIALRSGLDVGISLERGYLKPLANGVREGRVPLALVDGAVRRILTMKFELGLFENSLVDVDRAMKTVHTPEHRRLALEAAREGIVLLKNDKSMLPLSRDLKSIAVIGPNADNIRNQLGDYIARKVTTPVTTVLGGVRAIAPNARVQYAKGCSVLGEDRSGFAEAVRIAKESDAAIVVVGENERHSPEGGTNGEDLDVASLDLTGVQEDLVKAVAATGTPTVVVLVNGRPLSTRWIAANIPAVVEAWLPGEAGGMAVAEVLFGVYNPSGKLAVTVPRHVGQLPIYYNSSPSRLPAERGRGPAWRGYVDLEGSPLYPFGHGLSYTTFEYSNLRIEPKSMPPGGTVRIFVDVENSGKLAGDEVVQLYLRDNVSSVVRPIKELKGFRKIHLAPGERRTVTFDVTPEELAFYNRHLERVVEPGTFTVMIGRSSEDIPLSGLFEVR
ncbi:MAG: glycoside hydrolase family 3 C-terminal domain-containing protein [Bryobacteraceae bacterium]|nr:glycoside hydrolase family 3 C-terminal domain-containing protein [Bryobacteraceae bacterium]